MVLLSDCLPKRALAHLIQLRVVNLHQTEQRLVPHHRHSLLLFEAAEIVRQHDQHALGQVVLFLYQCLNEPNAGRRVGQFGQLDEGHCCVQHREGCFSEQRSHQLHFSQSARLAERENNPLRPRVGLEAGLVQGLVQMVLQFFVCLDVGSDRRKQVLLHENCSLLYVKTAHQHFSHRVHGLGRPLLWPTELEQSLPVLHLAYDLNREGKRAAPVLAQHFPDLVEQALESAIFMQPGQLCHFGLIDGLLHSVNFILQADKVYDLELFLRQFPRACNLRRVGLTTHLLPLLLAVLVGRVLGLGPLLLQLGGLDELEACSSPHAQQLAFGAVRNSLGESHSGLRLADDFHLLIMDLDSAINEARSWPDPLPFEPSLSQLLEGRLPLHVKTDYSANQIIALQPVTKLIPQSHHATLTSALSAPPLPEFSSDDSVADRCRLSIAMNQAAAQFTAADLRQLEDQVSNLFSQKYSISSSDVNQNSLTFAFRYGLLNEQIEEITYFPLGAKVKWSKRLDSSMKGPHFVKVLASKKRARSKGQEGAKLGSQLLRQLQILGGILDQQPTTSSSSQLQYFTEVMKISTLNPSWHIAGTEGSESTSCNYQDFYNQIYDKIREEQAQKEDLETFPKARDAITEAMLTTVIQKIYQERQAEEEAQQPSEFAEKSLPQNVVARTHRFAEEDRTELANFYDILPKDKFAMSYPFELDEFQKRAVLHLEKGESVFVAAHTSAGKTVVAEYGIALAIKHKRKVIYTSPIKALSNQKFRQFSEKFQSVGIQTGDISLNGEASCVIMTTEILRNCLYKGADMVRDIEWVVFDEVHYVNNRERGVVWEETILLLPEHIGIIMLSATVPNYMDFADWVGRTKNRKIFVMKTLYRPVPLEHSLYLFKQFHVVKEANGSFLREAYVELQDMIQQAVQDKRDTEFKMGQKKKDKLKEKGFWNDNRRQQRLKYTERSAIKKYIKKVEVDHLNSQAMKTESTGLIELIIECEKKELLPCVIFCFSKKRISDLAAKIYTHKLNNNSEEQRVRTFFHKAIAHLKPEDRELPQLRQILELSRCGYAIHHGDLMPLAKEIVELLFGEGLIKVLLATQTFAMGINMPTRTVIFHSVKKIDPESTGNFVERFLNSSEYVQMSGRAGRRGLDEKGNVIIWVRDPTNLPDAVQMVKLLDHHGEQLKSKFRVTYSIILNLLISKDLSVVDMIRNSFLENDKFNAIPACQQRIRHLKEEYDQLAHVDCPYMAMAETLPPIESHLSVCSFLREHSDLSLASFKKLDLPKIGLLFGLDHEVEFCGVVGAEQHRVKVLVARQNSFSHSLKEYQFNKKKEHRKVKIGEPLTFKQVKGAGGLQYAIVKVRFQDLLDIINDKIDIGKGRMMSEDSYQSYEELAKIVNQKNRTQTPSEHLTKGVSKLIRGDFQLKRSQYQQFQKSRCRYCPQREAHFGQLARRKQIRNQLQQLIQRVDRNDLSQKASFAGMLRVLKSLRFVDKEDMLLLKGRVARQVGDIYIAQLMLEGILDELSPAAIASVLSGFVNQFKARGKRNQELVPDFPMKVERAITRVRATVDDVAQKEVDEGAFICQKEQLINSVLNYSLKDQIYWWADGLDFILICEFSQAQEGIIIKTIMRLEILLRNMAGACKLLGNQKLAQLLTDCSSKIKRDVVFSQSLYLK